MAAAEMWADRVFTNTSLGARLWHRLDLTNLRHIFYFVSPYETAAETLDEIPNYNVQVRKSEATAAIFVHTFFFSSSFSCRSALGG